MVSTELSGWGTEWFYFAVTQWFLMFSRKLSHKGGTVKEEHLAEQLSPWRSKPD
jgi:hypothetical protein